MKVMIFYLFFIKYAKSETDNSPPMENDHTLSVVEKQIKFEAKDFNRIVSKSHGYETNLDKPESLNTQKFTKVNVSVNESKELDNAMARKLENVLIQEEAKNGLNSREIQAFMNKDSFRNDAVLKNTKRQPNSKTDIHSHDMPYLSLTRFGKGMQVKLTNSSTTSVMENYTKVLSSSKIFKIEAVGDTIGYINLVSTTKLYHPQFRLYEVKDDKFNLMQNINFSNEFFFSNKSIYILEIGSDSKIRTDPFPDLKTGGFRVVISSEVRTISKMLNEEGIKLRIWGFEGIASFTNKSDLNLFHDSSKNISHGILNYSITPFYNIEVGTLTVYFHNGSSRFTDKIMRATTIEIKCNKGLFEQKVYYGTEQRPAIYHFDVQSKRICELFDIIK